MKKFLFSAFILFCLQLTPAKAQWVTIPDANFVYFLTQNFPSCMNGNLMDTTCTQVVGITSITINDQFLVDLTGIQYFDNLLNLDCYNNLLTSLPPLPQSLLYLDCTNNQLTNLPMLPNSLKHLDCFDNQLNALPSLPGSLTHLQCSFNQIAQLPTLPNELEFLSCRNNQLINLPTLNDSLKTLFCSINQLSSLPSLPNSLLSLDCSSNQITSLPFLPVSLLNLYCSYNLLNYLPILPTGLNTLACAYNQLTYLGEVPNQMTEFYVNNNNILCLANLPEVDITFWWVDISNNPFTCVPNQTMYSMGFPLCIADDSIYNPNNCPGVNIMGNVYSDLNNNCLNNLTDHQINNFPIQLFDSLNNLIAQSYTSFGNYAFSTLSPGAYNVAVDFIGLPLTMDCMQASIQNVNLSSTNQTITDVNFPVNCDTTNDINIYSVVSLGIVFPGEMYNLYSNISYNSNWYNLDCNSTLTSGIVTFQVNGPVTFVSPVSGALIPQVSGNNFTYFIADFDSITYTSFGLQFLTDTTAQAGDQICVHVEINPSPLDADTTNNVYDFCYQVVNSYDPNIKEVYPVNVLPGYDDWFTYTIHFQNTGNAPAFNIRLRDTLDANLDINTFEIRGYSHPAIVSINGNNLTVRFNNIMLPDSTSDYEGSMGYFQYRIKPLPNLPLGTQIENTAYIYFDYNAPIVTNTTQNNFQTVVSTFNAKDDTNQLKVFPNPANEILNINLQNNNIENCIITNALGQTVYNSANEINTNYKIQLNISNLNSGVYFVKVRSSNGSYTAKFFKSE
jgi:uncharacterized repeat protein (TIGR01451 family)